MGRDEATPPLPHGCHDGHGRRRPGAEFATAALLVAGALAVRLLAGTRYEVIPRDGIDFLRQAALLVAGDWRAALDWYQHPLTAGLFAAVTRASGLAPEAAASVATIACGALAVVPVYFLGAMLFGRRAGLAAGVLFAVLPLAVRLSVRPLSEAPFHLLFLGSACAGVGVLGRHRMPAAILAGFLGGLAFLVRPEGLAAPLVGGTLLLLLPAAGVPLRRRLGLALLVSVGALLVAGPYVAYLSSARGALTLTAKKDVSVLSGARSDRPVQRLSDEGLSDRPGRTAAELGRHLGEALSWAPLALAVLGLAVPGRPRSRGQWFLALIVALLLVVLFRVGYTYGYVARRHLLTPGVLLLPWSGAGLAVLAGWIGRAGWFRRREDGRPRPTAALAGLVVLLTAGLLPMAWKRADQRHLPLKELGLRARADLGPGLRLAPLGYPRVAYYAGSRRLAVLPEHQDAWCDEPTPHALAALGSALDRARATHVVLASRQPAGARTWIAAHATELFRAEQHDSHRWWAVCRYRGSASQ